MLHGDNIGKVNNWINSIIYINRVGGVGGAIAFQIAINGKILGSIAPNTYHIIEVEPGEYSISSISNENSDFVNLNTLAGNNYYLKVIAQMGIISARVKISQVSEDVGIKMVNKSKRAKSMNY